MRHGMWLTVIVTSFSLSSAGCATEQWTQELFTKRQVEVDEQFTEQGQRIQRVEGRVSYLEVAMTETREQVRDALTPSPTVRSPKRPTRSTTDKGTSAGRTLIAVVHVPFGFDRADFDASAEAALASIIRELRENRNLAIELEGTTDSVGRFDYNVRLSQRRVAAVTRWLTEKGVDRARILGATSRGPVADASLKDSAKRRVMVKLMTSTD
jgi:outer membrane protein OmpA-like peptidoglycan-associated protein